MILYDVGLIRVPETKFKTHIDAAHQRKDGRTIHVLKTITIDIIQVNVIWVGSKWIICWLQNYSLPMILMLISLLRCLRSQNQNDFQPIKIVTNVFHIYVVRLAGYTLIFLWKRGDYYITLLFNIRLTTHYVSAVFVRTGIVVALEKFYW